MDLFDAVNKNDHEKIVSFLEKDGGNPNIQDEHGNTPLHYSILNNFPFVTSMLLKHGADYYKKNNAGEHPMLWCMLYAIGKTRALVIDFVSARKLAW